MKYYLVFLFSLYFNCLNAHICYIKQENNKIIVYNCDNSNKSIYIGNSQLIGYNDDYIVIKESHYIKIYNINGVVNGSFYLNDDEQVEHMGCEYIVIKNNYMVKYYNYSGKQVRV